jgi:hypothetical protein
MANEIGCSGKQTGAVVRLIEMGFVTVIAIWLELVTKVKLVDIITTMFVQLVLALIESAGCVLQPVNIMVKSTSVGSAFTSISSKTVSVVNLFNLLEPALVSMRSKG